MHFCNQQKINGASKQPTSCWHEKSKYRIRCKKDTAHQYKNIIANGMVEGEDDLRNFGGRIYREAGRLAALVNDILTSEMIPWIKTFTGRIVEIKCSNECVEKQIKEDFEMMKRIYEVR